MVPGSLSLYPCLGWREGGKEYHATSQDSELERERTDHKDCFSVLELSAIKYRKTWLCGFMSLGMKKCQ
ncbi:hypothetical protein FKM82_008393 [Ascaphus truei]